jgi:branched-chain amino acid transport system ATP-binding protein
MSAERDAAVWRGGLEQMRVVRAGGGDGGGRFASVADPAPWSQAAAVRERLVANMNDFLEGAGTAGVGGGTAGKGGTGKTTFMNTLAGATRQHGGTIALDGVALHKVPLHERAGAGIGWVPQERNIFKSLTVDENLTAVARRGAWTPERVYQMFPRLAERRRQAAGLMSGGEQQMLALGRALASAPRVLLIDELSLGLAPIIVKSIYDQLRQVRAAFGTAMLVVEQNARLALEICDTAHVLERGAIVLSGTADAVAGSERMRESYLGTKAESAL